MTWYTLICYRPDGADYCRGCLMDRSSSDHTVVESDDPEVIATMLAALRKQDRDSERHVSAWETTLLIDGRTDSNFEDDDGRDDLSLAISNRAEVLWSEILVAEEAARNAAKIAAAEQAAREKEERAIAREKSERQELKRLQAKYGAKA